MQPEDTSLLQHVEPERRRRLLAIAARSTYPAGAILFREGEPATAVQLLLDGEVCVFTDSGGEEVELGRLGPGEVVGEMAALGRRPRSATVRTLRPCETLVFTWTEVERLMYEDGRLATDLLTAICSILSARLMRMNQRVAQAGVRA